MAKNPKSTFKTATLAQVCALVTDGTHDTPKVQDTGFPLIKAKEIVTGIIDFDNCDFISEDDHNEVISRSKAEKWDTLFTHIGASLGATALVKTNRPFSIKNIALFKPNPEIIDPKYFYYTIISHAFQEHVKLQRTGAAQPFLGLGQLRGIKINYIAALPTQRKIAAILSAYDDLIENNNRRIAILEKMAEEIYREWFVRLRFPGHEGVKIVKGVPEGWEVRSALELMHVLGGGTPPTDVPNFWDGEIPFFTPKDSHDGYYANLTEKSITPLGLENCNSPLYPKNTIFITARGTVGNIVLALRPMAMNQSCYALKPISGQHEYFYFLAMRNTVGVIKGTANSGVFDNIITDSFKQFTLFNPENNLLDEFEMTVSPMMKQIEIAIQSNLILKTTRDRLLSRLMSGKIDVEKLDIAFPKSMLALSEAEGQEAQA